MHDIWAFLYQTLTLSLVAALLLILKAIFRDKLTPRWQYGVWAILALRAAVPAGLSGQQLLPLEQWLSAARALAESRLSSAFTDLWGDLRLTAPFPWLTAAPRSVTDWLFVFYAAGVVLALFWFFLGYLRLRARLTPAPERAEQVARVARQYALPLPRVAEGEPASAFVCAPLHPVLVLPRGREVDDKVILHELLHLKYGDLWLNLLCCLLRCLHWCNPFLWMVFDRVGNDAEALCDQRVLERLEGEQRRDYGRILLSMADDRHARVPGTTSMANGARRIKVRIEAIARFKRYPRGMALVSLCMVLILAPACLTGSAWAVSLPAVSDHDARAQLSREELSTVLLRDFALARSCRPATVAGALDCYGKAVVNNNAYFLAAVSDSETQQALYQTLLERNDETWEWGNYYLDMGVFLADDPDRTLEQRRWLSGSLSPYLVLNLAETEGGYTAAMAFFYEYADEESHPHVCWLVHQVALTCEDGGWLVEPREVSEPAELSDLDSFDFAWGYRYFSGYDLARLDFAPQDGLESALLIQRISLFSDETLHAQPNDHSAMICGFGNNLTVSPDLDAQFASSRPYGCLEIRYPGASADADYLGHYEFDVFAGERQLISANDPTSGFFPMPSDAYGDGVLSTRIAVGELEADDGTLVDHIQFTFALAREDPDGGQSPVAYLPLHSEYFDLGEVVS